MCCCAVAAAGEANKQNYRSEPPSPAQGKIRPLLDAMKEPKRIDKKIRQNGAENGTDQDRQNLNTTSTLRLEESELRMIFPKLSNESMAKTDMVKTEMSMTESSMTAMSRAEGSEVCDARSDVGVVDSLSGHRSDGNAESGDGSDLSDIGKSFGNPRSKSRVIYGNGDIGSDDDGGAFDGFEDDRSDSDSGLCRTPTASKRILGNLRPHSPATPNAPQRHRSDGTLSAALQSDLEYLKNKVSHQQILDTFASDVSFPWPVWDTYLDAYGNVPSHSPHALPPPPMPLPACKPGSGVADGPSLPRASPAPLASGFTSSSAKSPKAKLRRTSRKTSSPPKSAQSDSSSGPDRELGAEQKQTANSSSVITDKIASVLSSTSELQLSNDLQVFSASSLPSIRFANSMWVPPILLAARYSSPAVLHHLLGAGVSCAAMNEFGQNAIVAVCAQPACSGLAINALLDSGQFCPAIFSRIESLIDQARAFSASKTMPESGPVLNNNSPRPSPSRRTIALPSLSSASSSDEIASDDAFENAVENASENALKSRSLSVSSASSSSTNICSTPAASPSRSSSPACFLRSALFPFSTHPALIAEITDETALASSLDCARRLHAQRNTEMALVVELFLLQGVDHRKRDFFGFNAMDYANIFQHHQILALFNRPRLLPPPLPPAHTCANGDGKQIELKNLLPRARASARRGRKRGLLRKRTQASPVNSPAIILPSRTAGESIGLSTSHAAFSEGAWRIQTPLKNKRKSCLKRHVGVDNARPKKVVALARSSPSLRTGDADAAGSASSPSETIVRLQSDRDEGHKAREAEGVQNADSPNCNTGFSLVSLNSALPTGYNLTAAVGSKRRGSRLLTSEDGSLCANLSATAQHEALSSFLSKSQQFGEAPRREVVDAE